jgi:hypothetical protein
VCGGPKRLDSEPSKLSYHISHFVPIQRVHIILCTDNRMEHSLGIKAIFLTSPD